MANLMEQRKVEFIEQMLNEVHMIPINEVVGSVVPLVQRGRHYIDRKAQVYHAMNHSLTYRQFPGVLRR